METYYVLMLVGLEVIGLCVLGAFQGCRWSRSKPCGPEAEDAAIMLVLLFIGNGGLWSIVVGAAWAAYAQLA
ncbi:MAG TPA: hypothetical protein ENH11_09560 [Candidatus Acetothermia bacterium]|nr:hypothetical protein [Candidatus Acetothermia bacterium]